MERGGSAKMRSQKSAEHAAVGMTCAKTRCSTASSIESAGVIACEHTQLASLSNTDISRRSTVSVMQCHSVNCLPMEMAATYAATAAFTSAHRSAWYATCRRARREAGAGEAQGVVPGYSICCEQHLVAMWNMRPLAAAASNNTYPNIIFFGCVLADTDVLLGTVTLMWVCCVVAPSKASDGRHYKSRLNLRGYTKIGLHRRMCTIMAL